MVTLVLGVPGYACAYGLVNVIEPALISSLSLRLENRPLDMSGEWGFLLGMTSF